MATELNMLMVLNTMSRSESNRTRDALQTFSNRRYGYRGPVFYVVHVDGKGKPIVNGEDAVAITLQTTATLASTEVEVLRAFVVGYYAAQRNAT